ncbi:MAG: hypothetical protein M1833_002391 [Piccolia ochrophora]|nr:MAG: hypothetical protein M1833_002391 [Piccolia ochrophora]
METYHGHVRSPADAIILFEACRLGLLPRVQRRLSEKERQLIKSGSVFVWDEREAGMRRWTDGKSWSASRVSGSFLTYREMEGKRGGGAYTPAAVAQSRAGKTPDSSTRGSDSDADMGDDGLEGYRYKPDGLMKQSFSITTSTGQHLHLISYYSRSHPTAQSLSQPSNDPNLRHIRPQKGMYPESTVHEQQNVPVVTRGPMPGSHYTSSPHGMPTAGPPGYARSGPAHPLTYASHPGYGWPPSPVATPPHHYPGGHYGAATHLPPPSVSSAGASPLSYSQTLPPTNAPPHSNAFDRPPPAMSDSSLPPPPPPHHHRRSGSSNSSGPTYIPNPSPRIAQAALVAQHQAEQGRNSPSNSAHKIDPRLTGLAAPSLVESIRHISRTPPMAAGNQDRHEVTPVRDPPTSSNSIPSIGALVNGAADAAETRSDRSGSRQGSRSPGGTSKNGAPQDIPSDKLGFGEDIRALRVLDRVFSA